MKLDLATQNMCKFKQQYPVRPILEYMQPLPGPHTQISKIGINSEVIVYFCSGLVSRKGVIVNLHSVHSLQKLKLLIINKPLAPRLHD